MSFKPVDAGDRDVVPLFSRDMWITPLTDRPKPTPRLRPPNKIYHDFDLDCTLAEELLAGTNDDSDVFETATVPSLVSILSDIHKI